MFSRGRSSIALCLSCGVLTALLAALCSPALAAASAALAPGGRPSLAFEPNQGQADPAVKFLARGRGYGLFLTPTETLLVLVPQDRGGLSGRRPGAVAAPMPPPRIVRMRLEGADANSRLVGVDQRTGRSHYLVGQPGQWRRDVPTFARVHYAGVYPGVSLEFYGTERQLEYDFVVAPGGDPHAVVMAFEGAEALRLDTDGDLVITTPAGELRLGRPLIYQEVDGGRRPVEGGYVLDGARVRFWVAVWDASRPLVIDPVLGYSTYLGGTSTDLGFGVVLDQAGNAYITGSTISSDFPVTPGALDPVRTGVTDVFVSKIDPTGTTLLYSTFLGGSGDDVGNAIAVDSAGNAYVAGNTTSNNFPVVGAFQSTTRGGNEAFVAKLAPNGSSLVYSTYLGSNGNDFAFGIAVDGAGHAYVTGSTDVPSFPNNNAVVCSGVKRTGADAFVVKLDATGATVSYCAFIGGAGTDTGNAIAADFAGNVWVAGSTTSTDLPVLGAIQPGLGGRTDGFVGKLDATGALVYLTYLGGTGDDEALAIAVDSLGNAYVTGSTTSANFPTTAPLQAALAGGSDAFVAKLNVAGNALVFSTYLGGTGNDIGNAIGVHPTQFTVYVAGSTGSADFPLVAALQGRLAGGLDAFVTKLTAAGTGLVYSTFLGGSGNDAALALAVDPDGAVVVAGQTASTDFPVSAPLRGFRGLVDAFVTQIADTSIIQFTATSYQVGENERGATISVQRTGDTSVPGTVHFSTSDGTATAGTDYTAVSGTLTFVPHQIVATFTVPITDDGLCDGNQTVNLSLTDPTGGSVLGVRQQATLTIVETRPCIQFSAPTFSVNERTATVVATITATRTGSTTATATVAFATSDGTATAGTNYTATSGTLTFAPGQSSRTFTVPVLNDRAATGPLTVNLALSGPSGASLGSPSTAVLTIVDLEPTVAFASAGFTVRESTPSVVITVRRSGTATIPFLVDFAAGPGGTAVAGVNYAARSGTLTFAAGVLARTFTVPILNDNAATGPLTVNLALSNPRCPTPAPAGACGASLGSQSTAVLTIRDSQPILAFFGSPYNSSEFGFVTLSVRRPSDTGATPATVAYTTVDGTASAGRDYVAKSGVLIFQPGVFVVNFTVQIIPNTRDDGDRSFTVVLSSPTGATLGSPSTATVVIHNDDRGGVVQFAVTSFSVKGCAASPCANAVLTLKRLSGGASGVSVDFATADGTASGASDYFPAAGTATFAASQLTQTILIPLRVEGGGQPAKNFFVILSNPQGGASLGTQIRATVNISATP